MSIRVKGSAMYRAGMLRRCSVVLVLQNVTTFIVKPTEKTIEPASVNQNPYHITNGGVE